MTQEPQFGNKLSDRTFECFICKKNGFAGVMIYLKGKNEKGFPIRIELDKVSPHRHRTTKQTLPQQSLGTSETESLVSADYQNLVEQIGAIKGQLNAVMSMISQILTIVNDLKVDKTIDPLNDDGDSERENPEE